jgi:hypothetical protein
MSEVQVMKTLPDNPHLDHLRQQAKGLLAGLREIMPGASLSDAQASLAQQYGFRTWTDLKAEVDQRRGQAEVADPPLARAVAETYGLGAVTGKMRSLARPDESGRRWSLATDRGRWAVRTMDSWFPIVGAETELALQRAAAAKGVRLPAAVRSRSGAIVESIGGHTWRVYEWLHSGPPLVAPVSAKVTYQVGGILSSIFGLGMPVDRLSPWAGARLSDVSWDELASKASVERAGWARLLADAVSTLEELEGIGKGSPIPEPVLCFVPGPGNVSCGENGSLVVDGWEHSHGLPPSWGLADALMHWTIDPGGGVNGAAARAMVDGYREAGDLPPLDLASFRGAVTGLANYVYGEVSQALAATGDEDRRFRDRSVRHLLSHLPSRDRLEHLLDAALGGGGDGHP